MSGSLAISIFLPASMKHLYVHRDGVAGNSAIPSCFHRKETALWQLAAKVKAFALVGLLYGDGDGKRRGLTREGRWNGVTLSFSSSSFTFMTLPSPRALGFAKPFALHVCP